MSTRIPSSINASMSPEELLQALLLMSANVTHESVLDAIAKLSSDDAAKKIGSLSVSASMSVKKVITQVTAAASLNLSEDWKVNDSPNMSMLAMAGHLIFLLPESALTPGGLAAKAVYKKSIGGYDNIQVFGEGGVIPAKKKREEILREWSGRLKGADMAKAQRVMAEKFPHIVKGGAVSMLRLGVANRLSFLVPWPIRWVFNTLWSVTATAVRFSASNFVSILVATYILAWGMTGPRPFIIRFEDFVYAGGARALGAVESAIHLNEDLGGMYDFGKGIAELFVEEYVPDTVFMYPKTWRKFMESDALIYEEDYLEKYEKIKEEVVKEYGERTPIEKEVLEVNLDDEGEVYGEEPPIQSIMDDDDDTN